MPVGSTIVHVTVSPFTNNTHIDKSLWGPVDECMEQTGKDNQFSLSPPPAVNDHLEAVTLDLGEHTADEPLPCFYSADD